MSLFRESADVSVRPAVAEDAVLIAGLQLRAWSATHEETLGRTVLDGLDVIGFRTAWSTAITAPPSRRHRVLVACEGARVVGFAAVSSDEAGHGDLVALEVDPASRRFGHGSRLLAAAVDHLRQDGATQVDTWVLDGDGGREDFLSSAGFGSDGATRDLATGPRTISEHRWQAAI